MFKKLFISVCLAVLLTSGLAFAADKININTASKTELQTLKGIGDATAEAIIQYREQNGSFTTIEELINVKGIGSKKVEKLTDQIAVSDPE